MDPTSVAATAASTIIATWGIYGVVLLIFMGMSGVLGWMLYRSLHGQADQLRKDLEAKYADAAAGRDIMREVKMSIEMNTKTIETAVMFFKGKV